MDRRGDSPDEMVLALLFRFWMTDEDGGVAIVLGVLPWDLLTGVLVEGKELSMSDVE